MKKSLPMFLLLISLLFVSCGPTSQLTKADTNTHTFEPPINNYSTALYKAHIKVGKMAFSGLFYFKKNEKGEQRIIYMSELGLTFLEMSYSDASFQVNKYQDFIDSKPILRNFMSDLQLLIDEPASPKRIKAYENRAGDIALVKFRNKKKKNFYFYGEKNILEKIIQKKGLKHVEIRLKSKKNEVPQLIEIKHKRIKLHIKLKLLKTNAG